MSSSANALAAFVEAAPPGELSNVTSAIKTLANESALKTLEPAYKKYNEDQLTTVKLPGASQSVLVSEHNSLDGDRYYDVESSSSFAFDHATQKASDTQSYVLESSHSDTVKSILKALKTHTDEHFQTSTLGVFPTASDSKIAILIVANKYSPNNFWNGRWRSKYIYDPSSNSLTGSIAVDVHYYEDGNVRLITNKDVTASASSSAADVVKGIAAAERKYQEELNRGFTGLSEGAFKGLRRQLPVTRQKMEWEKVSSYRVGQDIGGAGRR
ncbi:F-actin-capping protein-like protein subunit alpha-2 [Microthyrium microscopicum]|uniref:F-actin-capping protein subunit alpha n=1 Tax=Microthyrium microscopicum TaxID=703497 RepID=A0A6A6UDG8_9PEZI|nr:F-actin-capping protein-like protein subunit alpha-2 [Microthyrium microscopicum]